MAHKCIMAEQWLQIPVFCQPDSLALHLLSPKNNIQILHIAETPYLSLKNY